MMQTWTSLVRTQEILRPLHVRQIHLAGWGQALDPPLWPIIDRLWALGLPTAGSCAGHDFQNGPFVSFLRRFTWDTAQTRRWHQVVEAFLQPVRIPGALFMATTLGLQVQYVGDVDSSFAESNARVLQAWCDKLDKAGELCASQEPPWQPWAGPALDVPVICDPRHLKTPFVVYLHSLDRLSQYVIHSHLNGIDWTTIAQETQQPLAVLQTRWKTFWADWMTRTPSSDPESLPVARLQTPAVGS